MNCAARPPGPLLSGAEPSGQNVPQGLSLHQNNRKTVGRSRRKQPLHFRSHRPARLQRLAPRALPGAATMMTGTPSSRAAISLASVSGPPAFLVTSHGNGVRRASARRSAATVKGGRSSKSVQPCGSASAGGSIMRAMPPSRPAARKGASLLAPDGEQHASARGNGRAASAAEDTGVQRSPSLALPGGRSSRRSGTRLAAQASCAWARNLRGEGVSGIHHQRNRFRR